MQRATSHKSKPQENYQSLLEALSTTTFFLVARSGPTVFNVRDEDGKIFKITISNPHACTCTSDNHDSLCIHKIFVLLKVLKLPPTHPLCHQTSLTDAEISLVLSGGCGGAASPVSRMSFSASRRLTKSKKSDQKNEVSEEGFVLRQVLDEEDDLQCPICQDDMKKEQALTWCRKGCGNNMHAKCMRNYAQYKISNKEAASCPLCREEWALDLLKDDCRGKASLKNSWLPVYCQACTFPQRAEFHRCIECSQISITNTKKPVDFCARCFTNIGIYEMDKDAYKMSDMSVLICVFICVFTLYCI